MITLGKVLTLLAVTCSLGLVAAGTQSSSQDAKPWAKEESRWPYVPPPAGSSTLPVLAPRLTTPVPERVSVCMWRGVPPRTYPVLDWGCGRNADYCTVFVAVPQEDGPAIKFSGYDIRNPPYMTTSEETCTGPVLPNDGPYRGPPVG